MKKTVFITAGDPNGIGPEITVKALKNPRVQKACRAVVIGEVSSLKRAGWTENLAPLIALDAPGLPKKHAPSKEGGLVSYQAVETGIKLSLKTGFPLVTAPISKQSWQLCGVEFTGHTELLRARTKQDGLMMFVSEKLACCLVTEHFALAHLPLTKKRVEDTVLHFTQALNNLGKKAARIGLCALNPHAGDNGKFGTEEKEILLPALKNLQKKKISVEGLFPSDDAWIKHKQGLLDGLVCMYHDQALLGLKLAAEQPIVHITAGLPFLRTSPTHGTAFDIAGKNKADPQSMISAILFACSRKTI